MLIWGARGGERTEPLLPLELRELPTLQVDQGVFVLGGEARPVSGPRPLMRLELPPPGLRAERPESHCLRHTKAVEHTRQTAVPQRHEMPPHAPQPRRPRPALKAPRSAPEPPLPR